MALQVVLPNDLGCALPCKCGEAINQILRVRKTGRYGDRMVRCKILRPTRASSASVVFDIARRLRALSKKIASTLTFDFNFEVIH